MFLLQGGFRSVLQRWKWFLPENQMWEHSIESLAVYSHSSPEIHYCFGGTGIHILFFFL